ncbi:MAG: branched chain amino acid aminotransferase, partial [Gemmatimonadetes bacterium]|nr:branched chain amino acid aminotransferase [Gemmatimonadota bacterium]
LEGAHNNFFAVFGETLVTHPLTNVVLPGITRDLVIELARESGIAVEERPIQVEELVWADEAFFTGTTTEVRPTVRLDGRDIGDGRVGPVTRRLFDALLERVERHASGG